MKKKKQGGIRAAKIKQQSRLKTVMGFALAIICTMASVTFISGFEYHSVVLAGHIINGSILQTATPIMAFLPFMAYIKRTPGGDDEGGGGDDPEKEKKALVEHLKKELKTLIPTDIVSKLEWKALSDKIKEFEEKAIGDPLEQKKVTDEVIRIAGELKALKEAGLNDGPTGMKAQIESWAKENKGAIDKIKTGQKADLTPLELKVASPMTPANTYNGSAYIPQPQFEAGINEIVRVEPTFWDYLKKGATSAAAYVWINKKNPLGAAGFIGPGVAKPGVSFEITSEISNAKKIAVSEKVATELLEDIPGMMSWVQNELAYDLKHELNLKLMTGVSSSTVPAGIQTISVAYSLTTVKTTNPNNWDAVRAAVAQLRSGNLKGPVTAFMNPIDYANMVLTKAISQGQYMNNPPETGATIVEDNNIPVGYVQVALLDYYKVLIYKDFAISFGWENDDFTKNLVTTIAEMRIHQFFSQNYTGAFIYDTLDNIKTAITA